MDAQGTGSATSLYPTPIWWISQIPPYKVSKTKEETLFCGFPLLFGPFNTSIVVPTGMDSLGGGFPALLHRTPPPGNPAIPGYEPCKMAEGTLLHDSALLPIGAHWRCPLASRPAMDELGGCPSPCISAPGAEGGPDRCRNTVQNCREQSSPLLYSVCKVVGR